jgi:importin subunit beta-1
MNLSEQLGEDSEIQPYALAPYLEGIIAALLQTTERSDGDENNLRSAAYETLSSLVTNSAPV